MTWEDTPNSRPTGVLSYNGLDYGCTNDHGQCFWTDLHVAQSQCKLWESCTYIYQSDLHTPATTGFPIYWARTEGEIVDEDGSVTWTLKGFIQISS